LEFVMTPSDPALSVLQRADAALEELAASSSGDDEQLQELVGALLEVAPLRERLHELVHALAHGHDVVITIADEGLTPTQAAKRLSCSRKIINKMIHAGTLAAYRLPESDHQRIPASEVMRVLQERDERFWSPLSDLPGPESFAAALAESRRRAAAK
jgi:excisionase family DNA binding protein